MVKQTLTTILAQVQNDGLELEKIKTRKNLRDIFEAMKGLVVDSDSKHDRTVVEKIVFGAWSITSHSDYQQVKDDLGYPATMDELKLFVQERRLQQFGVSATAAEYLKFLTHGTYKVDGDGSDSSFFRVVGEAKTSPAQQYRKCLGSTRNVMAIYLRDDFMRDNFFQGRIKDWQEFERQVAVLKGFGDGMADYDAPSVFRENLKKILEGGKNPRIKYAALSALATKYFVHSTGEIKNPVWEGDTAIFPGPDSLISPAFHMMLIQLSCLGMSDERFEKMEREWKRVNRSFEPAAISEFRPHMLQLMSHESGSTKIAQVQKVQEKEEVIAKIEQLEDVEDVDEAIMEEFEEGTIGKILAIRERKFGFKN